MCLSTYTYKCACPPYTQWLSHNHSALFPAQLAFATCDAILALRLWRHQGAAFISVQSLSRVWLWDTMDCIMPGFPVHHQILELTQTHVHWVDDVIQPSHPLSSPSPLAFNLSQHQGLFQGVSSSHQIAKVLEFNLQHQSSRWTLRTDLL